MSDNNDDNQELSDLETRDTNRGGRPRARACQVCIAGSPVPEHECPRDPNFRRSSRVMHSPIANRTRQSTLRDQMPLLPTNASDNSSLRTESDMLSHTNNTNMMSILRNVNQRIGNTDAEDNFTDATEGDDRNYQSRQREMPPPMNTGLRRNTASVSQAGVSTTTVSYADLASLTGSMKEMTHIFKTSFDQLTRSFNNLSRQIALQSNRDVVPTSVAGASGQTTDNQRRTNPPVLVHTVAGSSRPRVTTEASSDDEEERPVPARSRRSSTLRRGRNQRTVFYKFSGEDDLSQSFRTEEIEINNDVTENMTKILMRKKKIELFQGDVDARTACEFLRIFDLNFCSLHDGKTRTELLRNHIDDYYCNWIKEPWVVNLTYIELAKHLLELYWDEDTRATVYNNFRNEKYNLNGAESFQSYVASRYYKIKDTLLVSERKLMEMFQHKCPTGLAFIVTKEFFVDYATLSRKLLTPPVRKFEEERRRALKIPEPSKRNLLPKSAPAGVSSQESTTLASENKAPAKRFFRPKANTTINELNAEKAEVTDDQSDPESDEAEAVSEGEYAEATSAETDPESQPKVAAVLSVAKPPATPSPPKWKDFEVVGDLMARTFHQSDSGNTNFSSATNRTYDYSVCGPEVTIANVSAKLRDLERNIGRRFVILFSGQDLIQVEDKEQLIDQIKSMLTDLFEHHQALQIVLAKPLPLPEKEEKYWTSFSVLNTVFYRAYEMLPEIYKKKTILIDTYKSVGRMLPAKTKKNNLYFVSSDGTPRITVNAGNYKTVVRTDSEDDDITWSTQAVTNFSRYLVATLENANQSSKPCQKLVEKKSSKVPAKPSSKKNVPEKPSVKAICAADDELESDSGEEFLGFSINMIQPVAASICWSDSEPEDEEPTPIERDSNMCIRPKIVAPRKIVGKVGVTRCVVFCDDGAANSFVSKAFVERVIRENPDLKIVSFPQKPVTYGLAEPGKFMKKVDTQVCLNIDFTVDGITKTIELVAEMPQSFDHDVMFGRNVYDALQINFNYQKSVMVFGIPELQDFEIPVTERFITVCEVAAPSTLCSLIDDIAKELCISEGCRVKFHRLVHRYLSIFNEEQFGCCSVYTHDFKVCEEATKNYQAKFYPIPECEKQKFRDIIERWARSNIIRNSDSRFRSPILMVKKADGGRRPCIDFRELNKILEVRGETVPLIAELKTRFCGAAYFSKLDFKEGFLQIPLNEESKKYTAFTFEGRIYEFNRTPFGTQQSSQAFIKALQIMFDGMDQFVAVYVDDLLIYSKTEEEHLLHLQKVFEQIERANMTLNLKKCVFFKTEVPFLGFMVSDKGVRPDEKRVDGILKLAEPTTVKGIQSFLGIVNFYRDHIPSCAIISEPLIKLTRQTEKFVWSEMQQRSFDLLKQEIAAQILLTHPDFKKPFYVQTDASAYGLGGYVYQLTDDKNPVIVAICSRLFNKAEQNYGTYEREMLAVVYTLKKYYYMLLGHEIHLITDHRALVHLKAESNFKERINRWRMELQNFKIQNIRHVPGDENEIADILSRFHKQLVPDSSQLYQVPSINLISRDIDGDCDVPSVILNLKDHQRNDPDCQLLYDLTKKNELVKFRIENGVLLYKNRDGRYRSYVPEKLRPYLIKFYHEKCYHVGVVKTIMILRRYFDWPGLSREVRDYVKVCEECATCKRRNWIPQGNQHNTIATEKGDYIAVDYFGPLPSARAGLSKILVVMDMFTKYVKLYPVKLMTTEATINAMTKYIEEFGVPKKVLSDNGRQFTSSKWTEFWRRHKTVVSFISTYRPASNPVERVMATIGDMLRLYSRESHRRWPMLIRDIEHRINTVEHITTGVVPCALQIRKLPVRSDPDSLIDLDDNEYERLKKIAQDNIRKAIDQRQRYFHKTHPHLIELMTGQIVYVKNQTLSNAAQGEAKKLFALFSGPYIVIENLTNNTYLTKNLKTNLYKTVHLNNLKI